MSILPRRWLLSSIIGLFVLLPFTSFAQVKIKEKVEIHPGKRSPESLADMPPFLTGNTVTLPFGGEVFVQSSVYAPLQAHQYLRMNGQIVLRDLQLTPFMYLGPYNGGAQLTFEYLVIDSDATPVATSIIPITAIQPLWEVNDCSSGQVFELGRTVDPGDGSEMFWGYGVQVGVGRSVPVRPASKFVVWDAEADYAGDATLSAALQDVCGNQVESPGITVEAKIVGGREWGELFDPLTGKGGTTLDSVREEGGMYRINFHAWGTEPHQPEQVAIHLATSDGIYTSDGTITVYPYSDPLSVIPGRRQIPPGDTTKLDIQMLNPDWTPSTGELLSATYTIVQGGAWAYLYSPDSTVVGPSITGLFPSVRLFVPSSPDLPDSLDVVVIAHAEEPCPGCMDSKIVRDSNATLPGGLPPRVLSANPGQASLPTGAEAVSGIFANRSTRIRDSMIAVYRMRFGEEKRPKASTSRPALLTVNSNRYLSGSPPPKLQYLLTHYGLVRVTVKKKNEILLGETRYYKAIKDPADNTKLSFKELKETNEAGSQDFSKVNFGVQVEQGGKLGVYWENKDQQGDDLRDDVIRLIGRYWEKDKIYSVKLSGTAGGATGSEVIEVTKPARLLTPGQSITYATTTDVFGHPLDVDSMIVAVAGRDGIPPQYIKGQMLKESYTGGSGDPARFYPSYRYEPGIDYGIQIDDAKKRQYLRSTYPFVVVLDPENPSNNSMGGELPSPTVHKNVKPLDYQRTPITISQYVGQRIGQYYNREKEDNNKIKFLGQEVGQQLTLKWNKYYDQYRKDYSPPNNAEASARALAAITAELNNGKVNSDFNSAAQTRIVASYGLLQMTHYTATDKKLNGFLKTASDKLPENLNDQNELMPAYVQLTSDNMKRTSVLGSSPPVSQWANGFDKTWRKIAGWYNPIQDKKSKKKTYISDEEGYGALVMTYSNMFLPQR